MLVRMDDATEARWLGVTFIVVALLVGLMTVSPKLVGFIVTPAFVVLLVVLARMELRNVRTVRTFRSELDQLD